MEYLPALYSSGCESRSPVVLREAYPVDAAEGPGRVSAVVDPGIWTEI